MQYRSFGRTGWQVSEIAFGGWQIGGDWGRVDDLGLTDSIQVVFNLFEQRPADRLFPAGTATNTAYIARVPFDSGSLIGHWTPQTYDRWEQGSVPHTLFRGDRFAQTLQRVEELKKVCAP